MPDGESTKTVLAHNIYMRYMPKRWVVVSLVASISIVLLGLSLYFTSTRLNTTVRIGHTVIVASVARSQAELVQGLSGTDSLSDGQGMLFVFPYASRWAMWMKAMRYPIDIVWLDSRKRIIDSALNVSPATYPSSFAPQAPALYALELPAGFSERHEILVGQTAQFNL